MDPYAPPRRSMAEEKPVEKAPSSVPDFIMREISSSETDILRAMSPYGGNMTDPVVRAKGLKIYREMEDDDQVKVCLEVRKQSRLSSPWSVLPGEEDDSEAEEYAEFVEHVFKRMPGTLEDNLYDIYSAIEYGFSVSELVYELIEDGPFAGKIGLRAIKTREPFNYYFKTDVFGNVQGLVYVGLHANLNAMNLESIQSSSLGAGIILPGQPGSTRIVSSAAAEYGTLSNPFPTEKFVIYSYNSKFGNPYGKSDLTGAFRSWVSKKMIMKFWNVWLERYASPFAWATYDPALGLKKEIIEELDDFLANLSARSGWRGPKGVELNIAKTEGTAGNSYEQAVEAHNRFIAHSILVPNLIGFIGSQGSGGSGGSYSLGKEHMDAFMWVVNKLGRDTSQSIMGEQIISRLVKMNFPNVDDSKMPKFKFEGVDEDSMKVKAEIMQILGNAGFVNVEEEWVREFLTLPKKEDGIVLEKPEQFPGFGPGKPEGKEAKPEGEPAKKPEAKEEGSKVPDKEIKFKARQPNTFEKKLKVKEFAEKLDGAEEAFMAALTEEVVAFRDKLLYDLERWKIVESGNPKLVNSLNLNASSLKSTLKAWLAKIFLDSKLAAFEELGRGGVKIQVVRKFAEATAPLEPWVPIPPKDAIDFFNRKVLAYIINDTGKKTLVELGSFDELKYFDSKAFAISGVIRDDILNDAKQIILNGVKRQDDAGTVKDLKEMFNKYVQQGVAVDDELLQPYRLATVARTNMVEAVNEGRRSLYEDPAVKGFVEFWQYSAILDDRTTDYCQCMDGKIFRVEDIGFLNPPAHFNCRSLTIPVTKFEVEEGLENGQGVEISDPCPDRADSFKDIKRDAIQTTTVIPPKIPEPIKQPPPEAVVDSPPAPKSAGTLEAERKLREELSQIINACPYAVCHSNKITMTGRRLNVGEFECGGCGMPFRVSNKGDLYLYDAGTDKWERASVGLVPQYFTKRR